METQFQGKSSLKDEFGIWGQIRISSILGDNKRVEVNLKADTRVIPN